MRITVLAELCVGCGLCASIAPELFDVANHSVATAKPGPLPPQTWESVECAAETCPTEAICLEEE